MNNWLEGSLLPLTGLMVVLAGIMLIIAILTLQKTQALSRAVARPAPADAAAPLADANPEAGSPQDEGALVAAITAAIACLLQQEGQAAPRGFRVRRIRRIL
ncbi:MAG: OadG family transporter subunit [Christensenellales bacterium]